MGEKTGVNVGDVFCIVFSFICLFAVFAGSLNFWMESFFDVGNDISVLFE